jgi:hypothetical protein
LVLQVVPEEILLGGSADLPLFSRSDRFGREIGSPGLPGLDLDKDYGLSFPGDNVYFTLLTSEISQKEGKALLPQVAGSQIFALFAKEGPFLRQIP